MQGTLKMWQEEKTAGVVCAEGQSHLGVWKSVVFCQHMVSKAFWVRSPGGARPRDDQTQSLELSNTSPSVSRLGHWACRDSIFLRWIQDAVGWGTVWRRPAGNGPWDKNRISRGVFGGQVYFGDKEAGLDKENLKIISRSDQVLVHSGRRFGTKLAGWRISVGQTQPGHSTSLA